VAEIYLMDVCLCAHSNYDIALKVEQHLSQICLYLKWLHANVEVLLIK